MNQLKVLVADDEPLNLEVIKAILTGAGHRVEVAVDGREAVDLYLAEGQAFDLVIMDITMPVMNGLEAITLIRAASRGQDVPILCASANASEASKQAGLLVGCDRYITKPFRRRELLQVIEELLNERR